MVGFALPMRQQPYLVFAALPMQWWHFPCSGSALRAAVVFQGVAQHILSYSNALAELTMHQHNFLCSSITPRAEAALPGVVAVLHVAVAAFSVIFQCIGGTYRVAAALPMQRRHFPCRDSTFHVVATIPVWRLCFPCGGGPSWYGGSTFCHLSMHRWDFSCSSSTSCAGAALLVRQ